MLKYFKAISDIIRNYKFYSFQVLFYEIIFNGTPANFISIMRDNNYKFNTQKKIWILE